VSRERAGELTTLSLAELSLELIMEVRLCGGACFIS
jgi:hypothetical protein